MPPAACILVVDDEGLIRWSLRSRLEEAGYRVLEAASGRQALQLLAEEVEVVLLDLRLPDVEGFDLLALIKRRLPHAEVVVLTAEGSPEAATRAARAGAFATVGKPFDLEEVTRLVGRALRHAAVA
jgi:DNA-binding NtrC family response regulator